MNVPEQLRYSSDHEWLSRDGSRARVGITDYAQDALGDVVFVQLPNVGDTVSAGDTFGEVESTKSVSDIYAPVSGTVVAVNDALSDSPQAGSARSRSPTSRSTVSFSTPPPTSSWSRARRSGRWGHDP